MDFTLFEPVRKTSLLLPCQSCVFQDMLPLVCGGGIEQPYLELKNSPVVDRLQQMHLAQNLFGPCSNVAHSSTWKREIGQMEKKCGCGSNVIGKMFRKFVLMLLGLACL